jgi:23S rRNA (adenine2503-C2)-methyltransferase
MPDRLPSFFDLNRAALTERVAAWGLNPIHVATLWGEIYLRGAPHAAAVAALPARWRERVQAELSFARPTVAAETSSSDHSTRKFLLELADGRRIETVLMRFTGRVTACVSSQAGCAMGCVFCATGQMGFSRHLTPGEIVTQVLHIDEMLRGSADSATAAPLADPAGRSPHQRHERLRNVVLMGMGEPLHNYDAVIRAAEVLRDQGGPAIGARHLTISTVGVIPGIIRLADEAQPYHLAVSLHAATQEERAALIPVAARWPLPDLMEACRYYAQRLQRRVFIEWALIAGRNDTAEQATALGRLLHGLPAQVNLIPLNPTVGYDGGPSDRIAARRFQDILAEHGLPSTVRQRRGIDIAAGCGQLVTAKWPGSGVERSQETESRIGSDTRSGPTTSPV